MKVSLKDMAIVFAIGAILAIASAIAVPILINNANRSNLITFFDSVGTAGVMSQRPTLTIEVKNGTQGGMFTAPYANVVPAATDSEKFSGLEDINGWYEFTIDTTQDLDIGAHPSSTNAVTPVAGKLAYRVQGRDMDDWYVFGDAEGKPNISSVTGGRTRLPSVLEDSEQDSIGRAILLDAISLRGSSWEMAVNDDEETKPLGGTSDFDSGVTALWYHLNSVIFGAENNKGGSMPMSDPKYPLLGICAMDPDKLEKILDSGSLQRYSKYKLFSVEHVASTDTCNQKIATAIYGSDFASLDSSDKALVGEVTKGIRNFQKYDLIAIPYSESDLFMDNERRYILTGKSAMSW